MKWDYKYKPKLLFKIVYVCLFGMGFLLMCWWWISSISGNFVVFNAEFQSHASNFSISLMLYVALGYFWTIIGVKFKYIAYLGVFVIIANWVCETLMTFYNTLDIIDAIYGSVGVVISFIFLAVMNKYGLEVETKI
ncbi:hypothetical protein FACS1894111_04330 [Clostridia bacterium]|nr:hypothetical protein FACS1894111_04330 [Clostridia bacterium]